MRWDGSPAVALLGANQRQLRGWSGELADWGAQLGGWSGGLGGRSGGLAGWGGGLADRSGGLAGWGGGLAGWGGGLADRVAGVLVHAVPQWQGALWPGARDRLVTGCRVLAALAGEVLGTEVHEVPVAAAGSSTHAGSCAHVGSSTVDGIGNRQALIENRQAQLAALEAPEGRVLTIGGDCGVDLVPIGVARYRHGAGLAAVWFDAHADCNTAASSPSGAFHGMVLRSLLGDGDPDFAASPALEPGRAVLAGTRAFDPAERRAVADGLVRHVPVPADPDTLRRTVADTGAATVYLHLDLDVLDPAEFDGTHYQEPGGLTIGQLVAGIDSLSAFEITGAAITECAATEPADVLRLAPVLEAVGRLLRG
ncbi:arginase family protein [Saccharomonospora sp. NPDC046836]|uniref:arginase family protein n=1 Tax=Saccharomonospora sp. NPDC046836 TaxID=3156921 RepID=UPI0033E61375